MKKNYLSLMMLLLILSWLLGACQKQPVSTMPTEVSSITSLKKYLAELESAAKEWQEDAYLINANLVISVPPEKNTLWLIRATFCSPKYNNQSLLVELGVDGEIRTEAMGNINPGPQIDPILLEDWEIDSTDAVAKLQNNHPDLFRSLREDDAFLFLERRTINSQSVVIWRLTLINSGSHLYLDAVSGVELFPGEQ